MVGQRGYLELLGLLLNLKGASHPLPLLLSWLGLLLLLLFFGLVQEELMLELLHLSLNVEFVVFHFLSLNLIEVKVSIASTIGGLIVDLLCHLPAELLFTSHDVRLFFRIVLIADQAHDL